MNIDDALDSMKALLDSDKYKNARKKINAWKERLKHADAIETKAVKEESSKFFRDMEASTPSIYRMFKNDVKDLQEQIIKKLTGQDVIID